MFLRCSSFVPCEKLILATSIPARIKLLMTLGEFDAGPIVQTIFVAILVDLVGTPVQQLRRSGCIIDKVSRFTVTGSLELRLPFGSRLTALRSLAAAMRLVR